MTALEVAEVMGTSAMHARRDAAARKAHPAVQAAPALRVVPSRSNGRPEAESFPVRRASRVVRPDQPSSARMRSLRAVPTSASAEEWEAPSGLVSPTSIDRWVIAPKEGLRSASVSRTVSRPNVTRTAPVRSAVARPVAARRPAAARAPQRSARVEATPFFNKQLRALVYVFAVVLLFSLTMVITAAIMGPSAATIVVGSGDTVWSIASGLGIEGMSTEQVVAQIQELNGFTGDHLLAGQSILVPVK